ncbi:MAG: DUF4397 domain-containing protein [Ignavibacteria bacterium]|nr:DUF4397 domain-containing protein [Ignavibacteria bacterium]
MTNWKIKYFIIIFFQILIFLMINSCGPVKEWPTEPGKSTLGKGTKVRFVNLLLENPPIDIYINNVKVYSYSTYKLATYYFDLNPGLHEIKISRISETDALLKDTIKLDSNKFYSINFVGSGNKIKLKTIEIKQLNPQPDYALVRFIHGFDEIDSVDIAIYNQSDNFLFTGINYTDATDFLRISPGTSKVNVFESGFEKLIFTSTINLEANKIYSIYVSGNISALDSTALNANILDETKYTDQTLFSFEQGISKVRFINGITSAQSAQILIDNNPFRSSIPFNQATSFQNLKAGARRIKINLSSGAGSLDTTLVFEELKNYTVYLSNAKNKISIYTFTNESKTIPGNRALLRIINASIDIENVLINYKSLLGQGIKEIQTYGQATEYFELAPGQNILSLSSSGKPNLLSISAYLEGGRIYSAFLTGSYTGNDRNSLMLSFVKDNDTLGQNLFTFEQVKSAVKLINGSPDFNGLDLIIDENKVHSNLNYKYATKFFSVNTGFRTIQVKPSDSNTPIFQSTINLEIEKKYLLFSVGSSVSPEVLVLESTQRTIPIGNSSLRFVNGIYDQNSVDVKIINQNGSLPINQIPSKTVTNFYNVAGGKNQIVVYQSGTQNVLVSCEADIDVGVSYTILLSGLSSGSADKRYSIGFLKETEDLYQKLPEFSSIKTNVRFLNGLSDNPIVDFYVDSVKYAGNINYRLATGLLKIPSGNNRILMVTQSGSITQIYSRVANIDFAKEYTFIVCGEKNFPDGFLIENPPKTVPSGKSSIRFVHAAPGLGNMTISIQNALGTTNIPNVIFKTSSNYVDVIAGNNQITVTISSSTGNVILTSDAYLEENKIYTVYILGKSVNTGDSALDIYFLIESNPGAQQLFKFAPLRSKLRFVNGSTDNPNLQLSVDNEFVATNVTYKFATALLNVNSGNNKDVKVFEFGSTTPLISQSLNLSHTKAYTFLVTNRKTNLEYILFENPVKIVPAGKASLRIVHGAFDLAPVNITFNNYTSTTKITALSYKSVSNYLDLNAGFNEIIITKSASPSQLILAIDATLEEGKLYTVYLLGNNSGNFGEEYSLNFLDETNPSGQLLFSYTPSLIARMRVINASPNSTGFDVTLNQTSFVQNILFGNSSGYQFFRSGLREIKVFRSGQTSQPLISFNFQFETNRLYSFLLMDSVSNLTPVLIEDLNFYIDETKAYVRFINASSNSPPFDIKIGNPNGSIKHSYFTYQQITNYEPYDPQVLSFVFTRSGTSEELTSLRGFSLSAGKVYTIIVMGFYQGQIGQNLQIKWFQDN